MNEQVLLLSKKHGQLKQATTKMVQTVMTFLDDTPNLETKLSVIETLRTVTEGKVGGIPTPSEARWLTWLADLCRGGARSRYQDIVRHQEGAGRHQRRHRHSLRAPGRDVRLHDPTREDRIHPPTSSALHREGRMDTGGHLEQEDQQKILPTPAEEDPRAAGQGPEGA